MIRCFSAKRHHRKCIRGLPNYGRQSVGWVPVVASLRPSNLRQSPPQHDGVQASSWLRCPLRYGHEQSVRTWGKMRPIRCCCDGRRLPGWPIGRRLRWLRVVVWLHGKQRSLGPCARHSSDKHRVFERAGTDQRTDIGDVSTCLRRKRPARRQMILVARWTGIVGSQKARRAIAVVQLAQDTQHRRRCCRARHKDRHRDRSGTRRRAHVSGMICIRPMAPLGEIARTSPKLSARITARIQVAGMPNRWALRRRTRRKDRRS